MRHLIATMLPILILSASVTACGWANTHGGTAEPSRSMVSGSPPGSPLESPSAAARSPGPAPASSASPIPSPMADPTSTASPTQAPAGTPVPPAAGDWVAISDPSFTELHRVDAVTWAGDHFVLAGVVSPQASGRSEGIAFWTSRDGADWSIADERSAGLVEGFAIDGAGAGAAVGYVEATAVAWWSEDGYRWTRVADEDAFEPRSGETETRLSGVASIGQGFVAIGWSQPSPQHAVIVASPDGRTWTRLPSQSMFSGVSLDDIAAADGRYLLVGHDRSPFRVRLWSSVDGAAWREQPAPPGVDPADSRLGPFQVAAGPSGWLLTASGGGWEPSRAWWSGDSFTWVETAEIPQAEGGGMRIWDENAIATPAGFVVVTWTEPCASGLWLTSTGRSWSCISGDPRPHPNWVVAASDRVIVAATEASVQATELGR
jgi:hypothetical protein